VRCKTCHYSLENLTEHRCPECGRAFDPGDSRTFEAGPRRLSWLRTIQSLMVLFFVAIVGLVLIDFEPIRPAFLGQHDPDRVRYLVTLGMIATALLSVVTLPRWRLR
jgi:hypothetical protein